MRTHRRHTHTCKGVRASKHRDSTTNKERKDELLESVDYMRRRTISYRIQWNAHEIYSLDLNTIKRCTFIYRNETNALIFISDKLHTCRCLCICLNSIYILFSSNELMLSVCTIYNTFNGRKHVVSIKLVMSSTSCCVN